MEWRVSTSCPGGDCPGLHLRPAVVGRFRSLSMWGRRRSRLCWTCSGWRSLAAVCAILPHQNLKRRSGRMLVYPIRIATAHYPQGRRPPISICQILKRQCRRLVAFPVGVGAESPSALLAMAISPVSGISVDLPAILTTSVFFPRRPTHPE